MEVLTRPLVLKNFPAGGKITGSGEKKENKATEKSRRKKTWPRRNGGKKDSARTWKERQEEQ